MFSKFLLSVAFAAAALAAGQAHGAQLWKWKQPNGSWAYGQRPPEGVAAVKANAGPAPSVGPNEDQDAKRLAALMPVVLYTAPDCKACEQAEDFLKKSGIPFTKADASDPQRAAEFKKASPESKAPALSVGPNALPGWEAGSWTKALREGGYKLPDR